MPLSVILHMMGTRCTKLLRVMLQFLCEVARNISRYNFRGSLQTSHARLRGMMGRVSGKEIDNDFSHIHQTSGVYMFRWFI